jgi:molybdopterin-guanine dinucleotide biosynthesis protein A
MLRKCEDRLVKPFDAIVLAGGEGRRLGGTDKAAVVIGDESLLSRAVRTVGDASRIVIVGPDREDAPVESRAGRPIVTTSEQPPGGGPVAAVAAGIALVEGDVVVVIACDMPFLDQAAIGRLTEELGDGDAVMFVDATGRRQFLAAAYRRHALLAALAALPRIEGASMRQLTSALTITELVADPETTLDCDTWDDIERTRQLLEER